MLVDLSFCIMKPACVGNVGLYGVVSKFFSWARAFEIQPGRLGMCLLFFDLRSGSFRLM